CRHRAAAGRSLLLRRVRSREAPGDRADRYEGAVAMTRPTGMDRWKRRVGRALGRPPAPQGSPAADPAPRETPPRELGLLALPERPRALLRAARAHAETAAETADDELAEKALGEF